jgi:tetrahydromethanopterin S-methyltransferase subunit F
MDWPASEDGRLMAGIQSTTIVGLARRFNLTELISGTHP